jgi:8-oxo-(d)GTP phosphatase
VNLLRAPDHPTTDPFVAEAATAGPAAAGVICWRPTRDGGPPEVLMVHRPADGGWVWPHGTPDSREGLAECAVRRTAEQTGAQVVLGRPLPPARHRAAEGDDGTEDAEREVTQVRYWAARVTGWAPGRSATSANTAGTAAPSEGQGDTSWVPLAEAAARLARDADAAPLVALAGYAEAGTLATTATLVIRHATARPRDAWARADGDRPLVASGRRQALALGALLQCWRPDPVVCSPWRRCLETMGPYLAASGIRPRTKGGLTEAGHRRAPAKAAGHVLSLIEGARGGALCTHRPVLADVLDAVRARCAPEVAAAVPGSNPYLHPGEVLVAHVARVGRARGRRPVVVAVERHRTR